MSFSTTCILMLSISVFLVAVAAIWARALHRKEHRDAINGHFQKNRLITPFRLFLIFFSVAAALLFFPIYYADPVYFASDVWLIRLLKSLLLSAHNTIRLFILDGDFEIIHEALGDGARVSGTLNAIYTLYAAIVYIVAPVLTAGFVLSFFKNASAWLQFILHPKADIYVMSELNECSMALAQDIVSKSEKGKKSLILFADVPEGQEEKTPDLIARARRIGALCFSKDISELSLKPSNRKISRKLYLISENDDHNIQHALTLIDAYREIPHYNHETTQFFVFASTPESEALLDACDYGKMKVRRIKRKRNLSLSLLREHSIFEDAKPYGNVINVVIVGLGGYGSELLKTICWYGQMIGYTLNIHAFDTDPNAEDRLWEQAPELMRYNHVKAEGEPFYNLYFHCGIDVNSYAFHKELASIRNVTTAYVVLGDDSLNIATAMKMRMIFGRDDSYTEDRKPAILAVVYSAEKNHIFQDGTGLHGVDEISYEIDFVGSMASRYTEDAIEQSRLEQLGREWHVQWSKHDPVKLAEAEEKYNKYEYYRRSSIAGAIHVRAKEDLGVIPCETISEDMLAELEHKRWNAYMRSEGYIGGDRCKCNHLAKTHTKLIPMSQLPPEEQRKDLISLLVRDIDRQS